MEWQIACLKTPLPLPETEELWEAELRCGLWDQSSQVKALIRSQNQKRQHQSSSSLSSDTLLWWFPEWNKRFSTDVFKYDKILLQVENRRSWSPNSDGLVMTDLVKKKRTHLCFPAVSCCLWLPVCVFQPSVSLCSCCTVVPLSCVFPQFGGVCSPQFGGVCSPFVLGSVLCL